MVRSVFLEYEVHLKVLLKNLCFLLLFLRCSPCKSFVFLMVLSLYFGLYFIMFFCCITLKCLCLFIRSTRRPFGLARFVHMTNTL